MAFWVLPLEWLVPFDENYIWFGKELNMVSIFFMVGQYMLVLSLNCILVLPGYLYRVFVNTLTLILQVWRAYLSMWCRSVLWQDHLSAARKGLKMLDRLLLCFGQPSNICWKRNWSVLSPWVAFWISSKCTLIRCGVSPGDTYSGSLEKS